MNVMFEQPRVTKLTVEIEPDSDSDPFDFRTRFHWERFGQTVHIDDSEYVPQWSYLDRYRRFDFDDESHPIYTLQRGAQLVIDTSDRMDKDDARPVVERLAELVDDARYIRRWLMDEWNYVGIVVTATIQVQGDAFDPKTVHYYTRKETESLWGLENGLGNHEQEDRDAIINELTEQIKTTVTAQGVAWLSDEPIAA